MVEHNIVLNIKQSNVIDTGIEVTQGDYGQLVFYIRVKDNDTYITNATKATMVFALNDGTIVEGNASISSGTYTYTFQGNELSTPGKVSAQIVLGFSNGRVSSCGFTFNVRYNPLYDRHIPAGLYITELEKIISQAQDQISYLQQLIVALQSEFGGTALTRNNLVNNFLTTVAGVSALDAAAGKTLWEKAVAAQDKATAANELASTLNGNLAYSAYSLVSYDSSKISSIGVNTLRSGRVISVSGYMRLTGIISAQSSIMHISDDVKPVVRIYLPLVTSTASAPVYAILGTDSYVKADSDLPAGYYFFNFSYII